MPLRILLSSRLQAFLLTCHARQIGLEHGRLLSKQIRSQIAVYEAMFQRTSKLNWDGVREVAREYQATLQRLTPDLYVEMQGIAEGASLDVLDVVALNCRSEIALGLFYDGCSSMGWNRGEKGTILAQNWDWTARVKDNVVVMSIDQPGKPKIYIANEVSGFPSWLLLASIPPLLLRRFLCTAF